MVPTMSSDTIFSLVVAVRDLIHNLAGGSGETRDIVSKLDEILSAPERMIEPEAVIPDHVDILNHAISSIPKDGNLHDLATALEAAKSDLHWRLDDGKFYAGDADIGDGYRHGNMHTMLVGPQASVFEEQDFLLGFFLLKPRVLYRDHKHPAPELYIPLTGPSGWRFELSEWQDHGAGSVIWNSSEVVHATRVYGTPFLALFAWTRETDKICEVVPADDWETVERELSLT